jgi:hypothetical protein
MGENRIDEDQVRRIIERGVRAPEAADAGGWPRFSHQAMFEGRWVKVVVAMEPDRLVVITVIG